MITKECCQLKFHYQMSGKSIGLVAVSIYLK